MADADFSVKAIISAQTSQFEKGIKNAQSSVNSLSSSISNITNLVKKAFAFTGVAIGTKAIVDFGKSCVQSANQAVKTFNILDNTVKATGADAWTFTEKLVETSKALSDSTNYSVTEIQKMQSVLLGFTNITGEAFDGASEAVLDMATVMGMDLTSAVQTVGKALDDPITGLDSLRRQGFKFTDEQKAELAQLVKNGKQLEAQKIILDTLAISYGGASKAGQDSFAKQRHSVENFSDTLGGKLIPVMQVFAEDNSKMINSLRKLIENMDFTPVINVITNLKKIFSDTFNTISGYLQNVGNYVSDFISRFNFKPIVSVLDTLIGVLAGVISKFKEINSQRLEIFDKLKEALVDFSNSETFQNIVNFVNKIIDAVFFLWEEIQDIGMEIRNLVVNKIIEIWNKIKELFQKSQNALAESGQDIASWGDLFYNILNNAFRSFQDFFGMIKALIHGDWTVAWEYAKLTVMRVADNILDLISTIANAFPDLINGMITELNKLIAAVNKVRGWLGKDPFGLIEAFESVDLSESSGLAAKIQEAENKIQELTGRAADNTVSTLNGVSEQFAGFTQNALGEIAALTEGTEVAGQKQRATYQRTANTATQSYKKISEWDAKLLQQRLEELQEYGKEYTEEYHKIQLDLIEQERGKAHEADTTGAETEKINEFYNKKIEKENDRHEKAKRNKVKETVGIVIGALKNIAAKSVEIFKKVVSTIKTAFSAIGNFVKNVFKGLVDIFSKLFEFNPDEALDNLLKIEDAILTFFVETLPQLPNFFETAFTSVLTLIQTLINSIDWDQVKNILISVIKTFTTYAPQILSGIVTLFTNLVSTISDVLVENAPEIISAIDEMFFTILEALPGIISNFLRVAGTYLSEIGKYISDNAERLSTSLSNIVKSIVDGISNFIESGGWRNILNAILAIQNAIQNAITENLPAIVDVIVDALPDLINFLIDSIVSASKALTKVIRPVIKLIMELINALIEVIFSDEIFDVALEFLVEFIEALLTELLPRLATLIPKLIVKIIGFIVKNIPKLIRGIITGLVKGFTSVNWGQVIIDIFTGFIDAIKDLFGIHSPSTLFESFGTYMVEGLVEGLKGISESVMIILQPLVDLIKGLFDGLFNAITEPINNVVNAFTKLNEMGFETLKDTLKTLVDLFTNLSNITFNAIIDLSKMGFDALIKVLETVSNLFMDLSKISFQAITDLSKMGFDALNKSLDSVLGTLKDLTGLTFQSIVDLSKIGFDTLKSVLTTIRDILKDINNVTFKTLEAGLNAIKDVVKIIADLMTNITKISFDGFNNMFKGVADVVKVSGKSIIGVLGAVIQAIGDLWNEISDIVKNITTVKIWTPWQTYEFGGVDLGKIELPDISKYTNIINALATGTNAAEKGLTLVGEAGPELVNFRGGEQVLNSHNTQKALEGMSGTTINQNVTFNNLQDTTAFAMLQQLKQYNRQMAINGII